MNPILRTWGIYQTKRLARLHTAVHATPSKDCKCKKQVAVKILKIDTFLIRNYSESFFLLRFLAFKYIFRSF